jgi:hypothetical protein
MNNNNTFTKTNTNNNIIKNQGVYKFITIIVVFLIIIMYLILFDFKFSFKKSKSNQETISEIFIILFFVLIIFSFIFLLLPNNNEFKLLFSQIYNVSFVILFTIFSILFYTLTNKETLDKYYYVINPIIFLLGFFAFYKSLSANYIEKFNINYERIKMIILLFCFITFFITIYNINPGSITNKYFGYFFIFTILISVFSFLYLLILLTLGENQTNSKIQNQNFLQSFSKFNIFSSFGFLLFLIITISILLFKKNDLFNNKSKTTSILILFILIIVTWSIIISGNILGDNINQTTNINLFKNSLLILFSLIVSGLFIFWLTYNFQNFISKTNKLSFALNLIVILLFFSLIYKTIYVKLPTRNKSKNAFFTLIFNIILYIPCIISNSFDFIGKKISSQKDNDYGTIIMLFILIGLIITYYKTPSLYNKYILQGGKQLVNKPIDIDNETILSNYEELNKSSDNTFDYQYGLSFWTFIDSAPPNQNSNYNKFTSILNFGNKPNILFNAGKNELLITIQQKNLKDKINNLRDKLKTNENYNSNDFYPEIDSYDFDEYENRIIFKYNNFLLQKWNNIIINYDGGTFDIFLNGELVKSVSQIVPYYTLDNLAIGTNNGIKGGICNLVYYNKPLNIHNINTIYNSVKEKNPPTLIENNLSIKYPY